MPKLAVYQLKIFLISCLSLPIRIFLFIKIDLAKDFLRYFILDKAVHSTFAYSVPLTRGSVLSTKSQVSLVAHF